MQNYKDEIAEQIRKNMFKAIHSKPEPESLAILEDRRMYGGKSVRAHPRAGYTAYSEEPATLTVPGPTLLNKTFIGTDDLHGAGFFDNVGEKERPSLKLTNAIKQRILNQHPELMQHHLSGGKIDWGKIWKGIKDVGSFVSKAAPIVSSLAPEEYRDTINKTGEISGKISGMGRKPRGRPKKHYIHHDIRMVEPVERHHKLDGSGFWKDFGTGFKSGFKGANKVASKVLPIVSLFQPELAPLAAASIAADKAMGGKRIPNNHLMILNKIKAYKKGGSSGGSSELYPPAVMRGGKKPTARGLLIKKVMAQRKCSLPEASKYIKQNNLM